MSHSFTTIWIHAVFGTKNFDPIIHRSLESNLHRHIKAHLEEDFESKVYAINGMADHLHILFRMSPNYSVKDILKNVKGESSHWINSENMTTMKFAWQTGYGAFSVSESIVQKVSSYIGNQKEHHRIRTYLEEYEEFITKHGLHYLGETEKSVSG